MYLSTTKSENITLVVFSLVLSNITIDVLVDVFSNWSCGTLIISRTLKFSTKHLRISLYVLLKKTPSFRTPIAVPFTSTKSIIKINDELSLSLPVNLLSRAYLIIL